MKSEIIPFLLLLLLSHCVQLICNPMDYSPPGSSVLGISQARMLEWVAISFPRESSRLMSPALASGFFTTEPPGKLLPSFVRSYTCTLKSPTKSVCSAWHKANAQKKKEVLSLWVSGRQIMLNPFYGDNSLRFFEDHTPSKAWGWMGPEIIPKAYALPLYSREPNSAGHQNFLGTWLKVNIPGPHTRF